MTDHKITEKSYVPAKWPKLKQNLNILCVYTCWRGAFDTIKIFCESIVGKKHINLFFLDWEKEAWIFSDKERKIIDFDFGSRFAARIFLFERN